MVNQSRPFRLTPLTRAQRRRQDATRPRDEQRENRARQAGRPAAGAPRERTTATKNPASAGSLIHSLPEWWAVQGSNL